MIETIGRIVTGLLIGIGYLIFIRGIVDFVIASRNMNLDRSNVFYAFLYDFTEPFYKPFRKILPQSIQLNMTILFAAMYVYALITIASRFFPALALVIKV
ncbi:MAG: YggT family protein [Candidatus Sericytochromatia bacterium]|nr:YggT family protein [Candidatus Sericytochromatia bacterium]